MNALRNVLIIVAIFLIGFIIGRKTIDTKEVVRYIKDEPVSGFFSDLIPIKEALPEHPELPLLRDTLYIEKIVKSKVDTAAIINDYITSREYNPVLFDNQLGKLSLSAIVQYNKLSELNYEFTPVCKEVTKYRLPTWQPYVGTSYNTFNQISFVAGTFFKKSAIEFQYISDFKRKQGFGIAFKYKL